MDSPFAKAPINKLPSGLLDFFGIKTMGKYPQQLADNVQPVVDLLQWYGELNAEAYNLAGTNAFVTQAGPAIIDWQTDPSQFITGGILTVPQGQGWFIWDWSVRVNLVVATDACAMAPCFQIPGGAGVPYVQTPPCWTAPAGILLGTGAAAGTQTYLATIRSRFFVPPGTQLRAQVYIATAAAARSLGGALRVSRFLL